ncbi:ABC transporter ATP-binding protein [Oceanirhabdus sp. W0125-5]|uniref:ABC transporter ATP-binding protein n=1 Tax=Oceanirhabdus sp. W0125-5 TaxID=2999116 RepID=UPI0022F33C28|nr:ABC transporter ATP-binding protein [Oceanirhabdus sp. W0125-5]WBW99039.1 ABC transporter ATP-binding protein [Oceanirhabdus sp. W0125-5]
MIKITNVSKEFSSGENKQVVLKNINFSIERGEFITIMGPSGGGKSTLLYTIALLSDPSTGEVYYNGKKVNYKKEKQLERYRRENVGLIFQNSNLISCLSPLENLIIAMNSKESYREKKKKAEELLDKVGLLNKKNSKISSLSGGEAQRVSVIRALVNKPKIILCDEPTGALDSSNSKNVIDLLLQIRKETNCSLVIVTHDEKMGKLGERQIYLKDGEIHEMVGNLQAI